MTAANLVLGLDVSTTATKAVLIDRDGAVVGIAAAEYDFETPQPLWAEQDPGLWWTAAQQTIAELLAMPGISADDIAAIGASGQMHGMVLLDEDGEVVRPAILWNDGRTQAQCDAMREAVGRERFIAITGNDALTSFTGSKMLWVREHEPEHWARARHLQLPKDYVRFKLIDEYALDVNDGAGTVLFDLRTRTWSPEILLALGLDPEMLPRTVEGPEIVGTVSEAGRRWIRGPGLQCHRAGGGHARHRGHVSGHVGRHLRAHGRPIHRGRRSPGGLLPCRAGHVAPDGRDHVRGRLAEVVARRARAG
jgi:xylulokinase